MTRPNVLAYLAAPDRECSLRAISLAVVKVRATGATYKEIGKAIEWCADTVAGAANETTLLSADAIFRLCYFWPAETEVIRSPLVPVTETPTVDDRIARIERELAAIRAEAA